MEKKRIIATSSRETEKAAAEFAKELNPGNIVVLSGQLGAGKTTFVQGLAHAFSIKSRVISPTFVLVRKHRGKRGFQKINLYHIDLYRLEESDMGSLGIKDIFEDANGIFLIEWGEKNPTIKSDFKVNIKVNNDNSREILINE